MHEIKWRASSLKPFKFMEARILKHNHSKSDLANGRELKDGKFDCQLKDSPPYKMNEMQQQGDCVEAQKRRSTDIDLQSSLKQEILQLQEQLECQFIIRHVLEKALDCQPFSCDLITKNSIPKAAMELMKEIAVLELEVVYLEQYLLSLYRKTFHQRVSPLSTTDGKLYLASNRGIATEVCGNDIVQEKEKSVLCSSHLLSPRDSNSKELDDIWEPEKLVDSSIHRSHSSLSYRSASSTICSPRSKSLTKAVDTYHSLPLWMLEQSQSDTSNVTSSREHLGACVPDQVQKTPNQLSEEMIRCISEVYCELAEPPLIHHNYTSSPISFSSSVYELSSHDVGSFWHPQGLQRKKLSSFKFHFENRFHIGNSRELRGPYCNMLKVQWLSRDSQKLANVDHVLQNFRSLVYCLEEVDLRLMKHEEKLAFWINVHNSLVMHAFLVYGTPKNNLKRMSLLLKAAFNVGGQHITIDMIQSSILGLHLPRPGQWFRLLFPSKTKFKVADAERTFAIEHSEPLLYFALCSGSRSDPAVRTYTPKRVIEELESAKEEYIKSTFSIRREQKILIPKLVESFAKDSGLCPADLIEMVECYMPSWPFRHKKTGRGIEWIPHNFSFRFLLSKEFAF